MSSLSASYPALPEHVRNHAERIGSHVALIDGETVLTYSQLADGMQRGAASLRAAGLGQGDRLMVCSLSKHEIVTGMLAGMAIGAQVLPVSASEENVAEVARYFQPRLLIADRVVMDRLAEMPFARRTMNFAALWDAEPGAIAPLSPEDIGLVILTSGTTRGTRRGAQLSHRSLCASAEYMNERMGVSATVRDLVTAPLEHGFGMGRVRCALHAGGTAVLHSGLFAPKLVIDALRRHECNMLSAAVSGIVLLLEQQSSALAALADQIHQIEMGTGHLMGSHRRELLNILPRTRVFMSYGLTEAIRCTFLELNADQGKLDSVGRPTEWVRVRIVDDQDQPVPAGVEGHIQVDGANKASSYFAYEQAWLDKNHGPWLDTGDLGSLDSDGYLTFCGRADDMINVGGLKVAPEEVEAELKPLLGERVYSVARIPDPVGIEGQVPGLYLETTDAVNVDLDTMRAFLRKRLPDYKIPRAIFAVAEFPRTATTRKIRRAALTAIAMERQAAMRPRTQGLLSRIRASGPGNWPLFEGKIELTRESFIALAEAQNRPVLAGLDSLLSRLRQADATEDEDLSMQLEAVRHAFSLPANPCVALDVNILADSPSLALTLTSLQSGGRCLLLPSPDRPWVARDLGWLHRSRAAHILIDSRRFASFAAADIHLCDAFEYPEFAGLYVVGARPVESDIARFTQKFGFSPRQIALQGKRWQLRGLEPRLEGSDIQAIWSSVQMLAARTFSVEAESLSFGSVSEHTPGWDSLGFVALLAALEEHFAVELTARDIMAVRTLGDAVLLIEQKYQGRQRPA